MSASSERCRWLIAAAAALLCLHASRGVLSADAPAAPRWKAVAELKNVERVFPSNIDSSTVFAWTRQGLFVSKDGGQAFHALPGASALGSLTALLVHPVHPATLYAGTLAKGVFASTDEGATWTALGGIAQGLANVRIHTLVFGADDPSFTTIFATHSLQNPGMSMTIDGGKSWRSFAKEYGAGELIILGTTFFFAGAHPAGGTETGFYRFDAERGWFRVLSVENPTALAPSRTETKRVWFGTAGAGLRVTSDFGVSSNEAGPQTANVASLAVGFGPAPEQDLVYAYDPSGEGVLVSSDNFKTSHKMNDGLYVGDWVAEGATMAASADGSTLFVCVNGALYRCARATGELGLSALRAEPAAAVAEQDSITFTCKAAPGATVSIDLSRVGGPVALALNEEGKNTGSYAGRVPKVSLKVIAKERERQESKTGLVALPVQARSGARTEAAALLLTVLRPVENMALWNGESQDVMTTWNDGPVAVTRSEEHPFSAPAHLRVQVRGAGQAGFAWTKGGAWGGDGKDARSHKILAFWIRSDTPGASDLRLALRDDGSIYGNANARRSNEVSLAKYLPEMGTGYRLVNIPLADFIFGSPASPTGLRELVFIAPGSTPRSYDVDDVAFNVRPGANLTNAVAAALPNSQNVRLSVRAGSPSGTLGKVFAVVDGKRVELFDDGSHDDGAAGDGVFAAAVPREQAGPGVRTIHFVSSDRDGENDITAIAFIPAKPPGIIAQDTSPLKLDGKLDKFAGVPPFVVGDGDLVLNARIKYSTKDLHFGFEVKDASFVLQPPPKKDNPQSFPETATVDVFISSPTTNTNLARTALSPDDHRFSFVLYDKGGWAVGAHGRWPLVGAKTADGYAMEAVVPLGALQGNGRPPCDFEGGKSTRIEFRVRGKNRQVAWASPSVEASNNPDNWGLAYFAGEPVTQRHTSAETAVEAAPKMLVGEKITAASTADITVETIAYMGWEKCIRVRNAACELVIVPQIGRVMHFSPAGKENVLWINRGSAGKVVPKDDGQWHNFGGDKVWPTPQSFWKQYLQKDGWPPPYAFDCAPGSAEPIPGGVRLRSMFSPQFGASCVREFVLDPHKPLVRIKQYFDKIEGIPMQMSLWSVTQVRQPHFALLPIGRALDGHPFRPLGQAPLNYQLIDDLFALKNDDRAGQKAGTGADAKNADGWVAAVYEDVALLKSHALQPEGGYPDGGCAQELFAADAGAGYYNELELLSPLRTLNAGAQLADSEVWQLVPLSKEQSEDPQKAGTAIRAAHKSALDGLKN